MLKWDPDGILYYADRIADFIEKSLVSALRFISRPPGARIQECMTTLNPQRFKLFFLHVDSTFIIYP